MSSNWKKAILAAAIGVPFLVGIFLVFDLVRFAVSPAYRGESEATIIQIRRGHPVPALVRQLEESGVVTSGSRLYRLGRVLGKWKAIKAGEYELTAAMSPLEILDVLGSGVSMLHPVTIPEGDNLFQIAGKLDAAGLVREADFIARCRSRDLVRSLEAVPDDASSVEGYLFPETYHFNKGMSADEIIRKFVERFTAVWTPAMDRRAEEMGLSRHQVVTLASIIEKETGAPHERPMISSVFHNRLKKRMRLESDPTTIYGIWENFDGNLRRVHLQQRNDYNTYRKRGLPVGPIANPGQKSLEAALHPADSPYIFFVSRNDGTHQFTATLEAHNNAVRQFQKNRKARAGKSWRDLTRKNAQDSPAN